MKYLSTKQYDDVVINEDRDEYYRNGFLMNKSCLIFTQCTTNHEFTIEKKSLVSIELS
jgi:hypothetical protein